VASLVELDKLAAHGGVGRCLAVFEVIHMAFGEGILLEEFDHAERVAADGQDVHGVVVIGLDDFDDFSGAAHAGDALRKCQEHAEDGPALQATVDHIDITRLEDVQGKVCAGEKDDV
jgi:hypothetical protein